jgi:hypothetical protein
MVKLNAQIEKEIYSLVEEGSKFLKIVVSSSDSIKGEELANISSWVTRLGQLIRHLYGENSQYFKSYSLALATQHFYSFHSNWNNHLSQMIGVAKAIKHDLESGLLTNFRMLIQADIFADFLEMGEYLLKEGYKDAATVIIGSVLEDGLRKLAQHNGISTINSSGKHLTIDPLNTELAKGDVYSKLEQKQITSWAHIRNSAAHGKFDEYTKEQVQMMLLFVQDFFAKHLR